MALRAKRGGVSFYSSKMTAPPLLNSSVSTYGPRVRPHRGIDMRMLFFGVLGIAAYIGAVVLEVMWLALCFGSIILGIVLLIFAPGILLLPLTFGFATGAALMSIGAISSENDRCQPTPVAGDQRPESKLPPPTQAFEDDEIPF